ncbi:MAG: HD domain-containing protein [Bacteriovoracaceae bacterium]|nr:HD domain-containing protein [Bacteriovoracaceae bacterium]
MNILICEPDRKLGSTCINGLNERSHESIHVDNGRDAQRLLVQKVFEVTVVDVELSSFSALEVIKFIRFKNIKTKIILTSKSERLFDECLLSKANLKKLGVASVLTRPFSLDKLESEIKGFFDRQSWRDVEENSNFTEEEITAFDDQFTSMKIEEFFCGNLAIFDVFIRLSKNKYLKILNRGESLEQERLDNYKEKKNVTHLYFKTQDRKVYINFLNDLIGKLKARPNINPKTRINFSQNLTGFMVQEIYTKGMDRETLKESVSVCESIHHTVESMPGLKSLLEEYLLYEDSEEGHIFLTMIYTDAILKKLEWVTDHSRPKILLGAMLHDLGKLKLNKVIRGKKSEELDGKSLIEYQQHPKLGMDLLERIPEIDQAVKLTVYQHHELVNGEGYPQGLAGSKIYPPAKVVGFANHLADLSIGLGLAPYGIITRMIEEKQEIFGFDPDIVRAFINCFKPEDEL